MIPPLLGVGLLSLVKPLQRCSVDILRDLYVSYMVVNSVESTMKINHQKSER